MKSVLFAATAAIGLSVTAAMAGGLAPAVSAPAAMATIPFVPSCPPVQGAVNALIMQSYTDITVSIGADRARVDALGPTGQPETFYYDCGNEVAGLGGIGVGSGGSGDFPDLDDANEPPGAAATAAAAMTTTTGTPAATAMAAATATETGRRTDLTRVAA